MENYAELKSNVSQQMKGHRLNLFFWLFLTSLIFSIGKDILYNYIDKGIVSYVSFAISMLYVIINDAVLFLFIKRVREETFTKNDIRYAFIKFPYLLLAGILISLIQMLISSVIMITAIIPPLFYVVVSIANLIFILWNALIAFGIYDGNISIKELIMGSFLIIRSNFKSLLKFSGFYIVWYILIQLAILYLLEIVLGNLSTVNVLTVIDRAAQGSTLVLLGAIVIYILNYTIEYALIVPIYLALANLYERMRDVYMPSCKREFEGSDEGM